MWKGNKKFICIKSVINMAIIVWQVNIFKLLCETWTQYADTLVTKQFVNYISKLLCKISYSFSHADMVIYEIKYNQGRLQQ